MCTVVSPRTHNCLMNILFQTRSCYTHVLHTSILGYKISAVYQHSVKIISFYIIMYCMTLIGFSSFMIPLPEHLKGKYTCTCVIQLYILILDSCPKMTPKIHQYRSFSSTDYICSPKCIQIKSKSNH